MKQWFQKLAPLLVVSVFCGAVWLLFRELSHYHFRDILRALAAVPASRIWAALALTALNYVILIGYDWLAIRAIDHPLPLRRVSLASFTGFVTSYNFGALLGGTPVRFRLYSAWGLSAVEILRLVVMLGITFWVGIFALAGIVFLIDPFPVPAQLHIPFATVRPLGVLLVILAVGYVALSAVKYRPSWLRDKRFQLPGVRTTLLQLAVAAADLTVAAASLYVLMPRSLGMGYWQFLGVYLLAVVAVIITHVPGGVGVFELIVLTMVAGQPDENTVASLLVFRVVYYLLPLLIALALLAFNEIRMGRGMAVEVVSGIARWATFVTPRVMAVTTFVAGVILLFSGATPAAHGRLLMLHRVLPLPVIELSHLSGSLVGILLILLAHSLQRRIETAYYAVLALLVGGITFSLLKGYDFEEAIILALILMIFIPCRQHFYRTGALLTERFSAGWFAGIILVVACTAWLMLFAYKHVEYRNDLWWQFTTHGNAPRSWRAMATAVLVTLVFATSRLLRSKPKPPSLPTATDLEMTCRIVANSPWSSANLALLGDKYLLFNETRDAFIMYGIEGRSWVSMGDPIADAQTRHELIWDFCELCDAGGRWPVFYQIRPDDVPIYVEIGLTLIKLGEAARVHLPQFSLVGHHRKNLRRTNQQLAAGGCVFETVEPPLTDPLLAEMKEVSDAWLMEKNATEKGFSLGSFRLPYIRQGPAALVRKENKLIAFTNIWHAAGGAELSVDLMRQLPDAPRGIMDFLFCQLMLWGKDHNYQWFDLGMAPLSGVDARSVGPLWNRLAVIAYRHGEHFYNFQGLRQYKDKFDPEWSPRYLASPGGLALPIILTNVTTLISGGLVELVRKQGVVHGI